MSNFMEIIQVRAELFSTDRQTVVQYRQTDRQSLTLALREFAKTPKVCQYYSSLGKNLPLEGNVTSLLGHVKHP